MGANSYHKTSNLAPAKEGCGQVRSPGEGKAGRLKSLRLDKGRKQAEVLGRSIPGGSACLALTHC